MKPEIVTVGAFEVNCIIHRGYIVDPGADAELVVRRLAGAAPKAILLTHAHFDHIGAVGALQRLYLGLPVFVHPEDAKIITHPLNNFVPDYPPVPMPENVVWNPDAIEGCEVVETPGHTPGGVCYFFPADGVMFTGDTLFAGSVGRTDLPGGDMATLMASIGKLTRFPDDTLVVPGHGASTTIGNEKRRNPFLQS